MKTRNLISLPIILGLLRAFSECNENGTDEKDKLKSSHPKITMFYVGSNIFYFNGEEFNYLFLVPFSLRP